MNKHTMDLRHDKLGPEGRARAADLESVNPEYLGWHIACIEADLARLRAELGAARARVAELEAERDRWIDAIVQRRLGPSLRSAGWMDREAALMSPPEGGGAS